MMGHWATGVTLTWVNSLRIWTHCNVMCTKCIIIIIIIIIMHYIEHASGRHRHMSLTWSSMGKWRCDIKLHFVRLLRSPGELLFKKKEKKKVNERGIVKVTYRTLSPDVFKTSCCSKFKRFKILYLSGGGDSGPSHSALRAGSVAPLPPAYPWRPKGRFAGYARGARPR